ncbi:MAG: OmpA family protein [Phormidesmis sp.]
MAPPLLKKHRRMLATGSVLSALLLPAVGWSQVASPSLVQVTVNSPGDGPVQADAVITLREAIALINGTLPRSALSAAEQQLVIEQSTPEIRFDLPVGQTTIELTSVLPAIAQPNVTIDGTTQPGYEANRSATAEIAVPIPVVTIRPASDVEVFRGLTLSADNITVRGLSLYGFTTRSQTPQSTPPADIFITHRPAPLNRETPLPPAGVSASDQPPTGIVIEQNWLGLPPDETLPAVLSSFGVSVFDSAGTTIRQNRIAYHTGSGIISGRQANNLEVVSNILVGNGLAGMPDAIRLDGQVEGGLIASNLICGNDGSGIFLFKPEGAVTIADNSIRSNGQRLRRAAVYVMGSNHRIVGNEISNQKGSGVTVTGFGQGPNTQSQGNIITGNRFDQLEGLSIDLIARRDRTPQSFQRGDGLNPQRDSRNRRQDTGNGAVNAPQFVSPEFFIIEAQTVVRGQADPNNEIQLYRSTSAIGEYGPLTEPVETVTADRNGDFEFRLDGLFGGEVFSAIATDSRYGTSEPARNTTIRSLSNPVAPPAPSMTNMPQCTTPPLPDSPISPLPPQEIQLEIPRTIHYGLDEDFINPDSAVILERIAAVMQQHPTIILDLYGHTDSRASAAYNQDLGRRRAENARQYLLRSGVAPERMTIRSFGETQLRVEETDRVNYARNRRVEFVFSDIREAEITFIDREEDLQVEQ